MRFGTKLSIVLAVPLVTLTLAIGFAYERESQRVLHGELAKEGHAIALIAKIAAEDYLRDRQIEDLKLLVDRMTNYERVLGFRLWDENSHLIYESSSLDSFPFQNVEDLQAVLRDGSEREMRRQFAAQQAIGFIYPLNDDDGRVRGAIQTLQLESYMQADARRGLTFIIVLTLATLGATFAIILAVTRFSVSAPIERLVGSIREVGAGAHPTRITKRSDDELGWLAWEFNGMVERLESARLSLMEEQEQHRQTEANLRNADRLASLGRLAAGLAHEIGTPLNVISGRAGSLMRDRSDHETAQRNLGIILAQSDRIESIIRDMLDFARVKSARRVTTHLDVVLRDALDLVEPQLRAGRVEVQVELSEPLPAVIADPDQLQQVFLNVLLNAMDAMEGGGRLQVSARVERRRPPDRAGPARAAVCIEFADSGSGIPPENRERVFDPFFTTKEVGHGTGLGLAVSYGIVREHGGWFDLFSEAGVGTRFTVVLPLGDDSRPDPAGEGEKSA